ncbi:MAG: TlpA family protein disulfide reductase [Salibacteraceae bacterium]
MRKLISFLLLISPFLSFSETVEIYGNASFFYGEKISVLTYSNILTGSTNLITETYVSDSGGYRLSFNLKQSTEIILKIEMRELVIPVHPGNNLEIDFLPIENAENQRVPLKISFKEKKVDTNMASFKTYQSLEIGFAAHQLAITKNENVFTFYNTFFDSIENVFTMQLTNDLLFQKHFTYFKANAYLNTEKSKNALYQQYLRGLPIQYANKEYLKFFRALTFRFMHKTLSKNNLRVEKASKEYLVYQAFLALIAEDSVINTDEERSLALLMYCMSNESNPILTRDIKNGIINQMSNFCPYPIQKQTAQIYQSQNNNFAIGNEAPEIELLNSKGSYVKLSEFRGKVTYLGFINSKSRSCVKDLQVVNNIKRKYRKVRFVFVVCDRDSIQMKHFPEEGNAIKYLFLNKDYSVLEKYEVHNYPVYYLLDEHGYFIQSPAKNPEGTIDEFQVLFAPKSTRKSYEIIKN